MKMNSMSTMSSSPAGFFKSAGLAGLAALSLAPLSRAHTWVEQFQVIADNGSYIGDPGYSRGYVARTDLGYNGFSVNYLLPETASGNIRITPSDSLCHPAQRSSNYSNPAYPKLQVQPGGYVSAKYLENGHVTLPWNQLGKPPGGGTVFVYGTTSPSDNEKLTDVLEWTTDGSGGNGKGFLMSAQNFDDGRCHQINCGNISTERQTLFPNQFAGQPASSVESWCETDFQIPANQALGSLTTYWVWQWPTEANADCTYPDGKDEYYTTCADFDIIDSTPEEIAARPKSHTLVHENPQSVAVSDFKSRKAFTTSPAIVMVSGSKTVGLKASATSGFASACSAGLAGTPAAVEVPGACSPVTVFSGEAVASASLALSKYETTEDLKAGYATANPTADSSPSAASSMPTASSATPSESTAPTSSTALGSAVASSANANNAMATVTDVATMTTSVTLTTTLTMSDVVTATAYATPSSTSADIDAEPSTDPKLGIETADGVTFATISTVAASGASGSAASGANNYSGPAGQHVARHAAARHHARHFLAF